MLRAISQNIIHQAKISLEYICIYMNIYIYTYTWYYIYIHIYGYIYTYIHIIIYTYRYRLIDRQIDVYIHTDISIIMIYINIYIYKERWIDKEIYLYKDTWDYEAVRVCGHVESYYETYTDIPFRVCLNVWIKKYLSGMSATQKYPIGWAEFLMHGEILRWIM